MASLTSGTQADLWQYSAHINAGTETPGFAILWTADELEDIFDASSRENVVLNLAPTGESKQTVSQLALQNLLSYKGRFVRIEPEPIASALKQLDDMHKVVDGWNGYSAPAPSAFAIDNARQFVNELYKVVPTAMRVAPSAVGGVGITLSKGEKAVYVEFYNDGSICRMLIDDGIDTDVQPVRPDAHNLELLASEATNYIDN